MSRLANPLIQAFDSAGVSEPGALLYTYEAGTVNTPKATYTDRNLSVPYSNPIVADGGGKFDDIYLEDDGFYKFVLRNADGELLDDLDWVAGTPSDAGLISYNPPFTDAEERTVSSRLSEKISVLDFGADKTGATDSFDAFMAAIAQAESDGGGEVHFPRGSYKSSGTLPVEVSGVSLIGESRQNVTIDFSAQASGNGIEFRGVNFFRCENLNVRNSAGHGFAVIEFGGTNPSRCSLSHCVSLANAGNGYYFNDAFLMRLENLRADQNALNGFIFDGYATSVTAIACQGAGNTLSGWEIDDMTYSSFVSCAADQNSEYGYIIRNVGGVSFHASGAESNVKGALFVESNASVNTGKISPDIRGLTFQNFFSFNNDTGNTTASLLHLSTDGNFQPTVVVEDCVDDAPGGTNSLLNEGYGTIVEKGNNALDGAIQTNTFSQRIPERKTLYSESGISVTGANTPICDLTSVDTRTDYYSGMITVSARSKKWPDSGTGANVASYVLLVTKSATGSNVKVIESDGQTAGSGATWPSFTWTVNNDQLEASPVGSTTGTFYFMIDANNDIDATLV